MAHIPRHVLEPHSARPPEALGTSDAFLAFQERLSRAAHVERSVLLVGERGTGKELAALRLHYLSPRWERPLITLNCAALAPSLIAPELFGYEAGAFTGAEQRRIGRFEAAHQGTLFLDEIGNIPMEAQEKILRVIEYGIFERVGNTESIQVDVRIIGATNADLTQLVAAGQFKPDLLDRLSFDVLFLPPLRERQDDILLLANHFAARMAFELGRQTVPQFSQAAIRALQTYAWPGNIRELKNVVERAVYQADTEVMTDIVFNPFQSPFNPRPLDSGTAAEPPAEPGPLVPSLPLQQSFSDAVSEFETQLLQQALEATQYNQRKAAQRLGLTYHQFRGLYRKYRDALPA
ncbi:MAG TPA: phage shock protein operon transcriptional activator [Candidatus Entotheonella sp.]|jgi:psp operon transcriptional activator